jgi:HEAT repeat protein
MIGRGDHGADEQRAERTVLPALAAALNDSDGAVRLTAVEATYRVLDARRKLATDQRVGLLRERLADPDPRVAALADEVIRLLKGGYPPVTLPR